MFGLTVLPVMLVVCLQATDQEQLQYLQQLSDDFRNYIKASHRALVDLVLERKGQCLVLHTQAMHFPWAYVLRVSY